MTRFTFGNTTAGETVTAFVLANRQGVRAVILDYGCTVQSLSVPDAHGGLTDVVLGYDTVEEYQENGGYLGAVIGRVANRIGAGSFALRGETFRLALNDGPNHLHGGLRGFDKYIWRAEEKGDLLVFSRTSPDGEEGYPGSLETAVAYELTEENELHITYEARTDADTIVNLTNHSYFNLDGRETVLDHVLQVHAERFTENDEHCLPTGRLISVEGTPFDFRKPKCLGEEIEKADVQLARGGGYDHNFVLSDPGEMKKAAVLRSLATGITMTVSTTLPGLQVYSGNSLTPRKGKGGGQIGRRSGICLETQVFPNAMACAGFPSPILRKNGHYHEETAYRFEIWNDTAGAV